MPHTACRLQEAESLTGACTLSVRVMIPAERDEAWAVNLRDSVLVNVIKPIVDKATEKGVDPVPALVLQADVTEEQAREYVAALENRSSDTDADSAVDTDEDEGDDASADADGADSTTSVSYGYGSPVASA